MVCWLLLCPAVIHGCCFYVCEDLESVLESFAAIVPDCVDLRVLFQQLGCQYHGLWVIAPRSTPCQYFIA